MTFSFLTLAAAALAAQRLPPAVAHGMYGAGDLPSGMLGMLPSADELVEQLGLIPHDEGGFFLETYRAGAPPMESLGATDPRGATCTTVLSNGTTVTRNAITSIYYLLTEDSPSQVFVSLESEIVHYWHGGGRMEYIMVTEAGALERIVLGPRLTEGDVLQLGVDRFVYKAARLLEGDYVLVGEAVGPGFDYVDRAMVSLEQIAARLGPAQMAVVGSEMASLIHT